MTPPEDDPAPPDEPEVWFYAPNRADRRRLRRTIRTLRKAAARERDRRRRR